MKMENLFRNKKDSRKFVSVVGDSISTYDGYVPSGYKVFYDKFNSDKNDISTVYDIWWAKVNQFLHAYLCVNNSYSGSKVTGEKFPGASSFERTHALHTKDFTPDLILCYIGFNDFGKGIKIVNTNGTKQGESFYQSYLNMLLSLKKNYPNSRIICGTLMESYIKDRYNWTFPKKWAGISIDEYNAAIKIACYTANTEIADIASLGMKYETLDGAHPTKNGHNTIANAWIQILRTMQ